MVVRTCLTGVRTGGVGSSGVAITTLGGACQVTSLGGGIVRLRAVVAVDVITLRGD